MDEQTDHDSDKTNSDTPEEPEPTIMSALYDNLAFNNYISACCPHPPVQQHAKWVQDSCSGRNFGHDELEVYGVHTVTGSNRGAFSWRDQPQQDRSCC